MGSPRDWLEDPTHFARPRARWRDPSSDADRAELLAARRQELIVVRLRTAMAQARIDQKQLAKKVRRSKDVISRLMTGRTWLDLRHIALFEGELGIDLLDGTTPT